MKEIHYLICKKRVKNVIESLCDISVLKSALQAIDDKPQKHKIIILLYHNIVTAPPPDSAYFHKVCLTADEFRHQMDYLSRHNRVIPLSQYVAMLGSASPKIPDSRPLIILTFDDGYRSVYTEAYPILKRLGLPATLFISTGFIGKEIKLPGERPYPTINYPKLNWAEVRELARNGFEIGSHTATHSHPAESTEDQYKDEINRSAGEIETRIGIKPVHFSWPYGKRHQMMMDLESFLGKLGFISASSACGGKNSYRSNPYHLNRIGISTGISTIHFRRIAEGTSVTDFLTRKR